MRITAKGDVAYIRLEDKNSGEEPVKRQGGLELRASVSPSRPHTSLAGPGCCISRFLKV